MKMVVPGAGFIKTIAIRGGLGEKKKIFVGRQLLTTKGKVKKARKEEAGAHNPLKPGREPEVTQ